MKKLIIVSLFVFVCLLAGCERSTSGDLTTTNPTIEDTTSQTTISSTQTTQDSSQTTVESSTELTTVQSSSTTQSTVTDPLYTIHYNIIGVNQIGEILLAENETVLDIEVGYSSSAAITSDGRLLVWGENNFGQLGSGTTANQISPVDITDSFDLQENETIIAVSIGSQATAAVTSNGRLFTWGYNGFAQLGEEGVGERFSPEEITSISLVSGDRIIDVSLGKYHAAVITLTGRIFLWGYNSYGCIGTGNTTMEPIYEPVEITSSFNLVDNETITTISMANYQSSAITSSGRVFMWGYNLNHELGDGTTDHRYSPQEITGFFYLSGTERIVDISLGQFHSSALTSEGRLFTWGSNTFGQLGNNTTEQKALPYDITSFFALNQDETIIGMSLGGYHSLAFTSAGRVFTWGRNGNSQLGIGETDYANHMIPIDITADIEILILDKIVKASLGSLHSMLISGTGRVFSWGENNAGQLGDHSITDKLVPVEITTVSEVTIFTESYAQGSEITAYLPTREGYVFSGWFENNTFTVAYTFDTMPASTVQVYGTWIRE